MMAFLLPIPENEFSGYILIIFKNLLKSNQVWIRYDYRPVTGGEMVCTCWDIRSVYFFCFLKASTLQLGMVETVE